MMEKRALDSPQGEVDQCSTEEAARQPPKAKPTSALAPLGQPLDLGGALEREHAQLRSFSALC